MPSLALTGRRGFPLLRRRLQLVAGFPLRYTVYDGYRWEIDPATVAPLIDEESQP